MKRSKPPLIPQKEFGFARDTFNLFQEWTNDGERLASERHETEKAREQAKAAQTSLLRTDK